MKKQITWLLAFLISLSINAQYLPKNLTVSDKVAAQKWVEQTYKNMSQDERLGQLFIVALYTNKDKAHIEQVREIVKNEKIGGLILMQDDAAQHIHLLNEFQTYNKIPLLVGIDGEWGVYQRIAAAQKFPWAITLGAIQNKELIYKMAQKIAEDCKRMGVNWDFAPVVDVNTNPMNPIIGNRSFGSSVENVVTSALPYAQGLQDANVLAAIKHFPGHGDTSTDSHLDLPVVAHDMERLQHIELAPFQQLINKGIGGLMVAHLYVPALEKKQGVPASISYDIITGLLKNKMGYQGLIITDALNMGAVANKYQPGELDALAFKAGNDLMLFSQGVKEGKRLIQEAINRGEIASSRLEESVKKILLTKYYLGLTEYHPISAEGVNEALNNESHKTLVQELYTNAITLLQNKNQILPLKNNETIYYIPLEEAPYQTFLNELKSKTNLIVKKSSEIKSIPPHSKVLIGLHKDNSTAYKPFKISESSKKLIQALSKKYRVVLSVFGSPYALRDINILNTAATLVHYENNNESMKAAATALMGETPITGKLPVEVNANLKYGSGINLETNK